MKTARFLRVQTIAGLAVLLAFMPAAGLGQSGDGVAPETLVPAVGVTRMVTLPGRSPFLSTGKARGTVLHTERIAQVITVTTTNDTGDGSLRKAILDADANPGTDIITFNIPGLGLKTITPLSKLPNITDPVIIDGTTQPGYSGQPVIEINGSLLGAFQALDVFAGGCTIRGLTINRLTSGTAIILWAGDGNEIEGNFIGTNAAGTIAAANGGNGIIVYTARNRIGGTTPAERNLISGNSYPGIALAGVNAVGNVVRGNFIGTDFSGKKPLGNNQEGVLILEGAQNDTIGGVLPGAGNIISGSVTSSGISIFNSTGTGIQVLGNYIGTDATGTVSVPNAGNGIYLGNSPGNTIGGTLPAARNVISGNKFPGVFLDSIGTTGNHILGNFIGTDFTGSVPLPNSKGIVANDAPGNSIGGEEPGAGNLVSGNTGFGIEIRNPKAKGNIVRGNYIGTDELGVIALGNGSHGIILSSSSDTVGGTDASTKNVIAFNAGAGIYVSSGIGDLIRYNSIFSNGGLGIDLEPAGVTPNDTLDVDTGPNNLQNHPDLDSMRISPLGTLVYGRLKSVPGNDFTVDLFTNDDADPSGYGEGKTLIASQTVTTDPSGTAGFSFSLPSTYSRLNPITATATDAGGNTSEFSDALFSLEIIRPHADELWISEQRDTIRWTPAKGVDTVKILYSLDDGKTYSSITDSHPASPAKYVWKVPDTLSRKCRILVVDRRKAGFSGTSERFKLKGYQLTRLTANGDYEAFSPARDGWSFGNTKENLWTIDEYVDYFGELDPVTGRNYPRYFLKDPIGATILDFPSWPIVVEAFGRSSCYFDSLNYGWVYRPSAVQWWASRKERFHGVCQGMAISSAAAFGQKSDLIQAYPPIGSFANLSELPSNGPRRIMIDQLWLRQFGATQIAYLLQHIDDFKHPGWIDGLRALFLPDQPSDALDLCFVNPSTSTGHVVTPYRVVQDSSMLDTVRVYVYDNNYPGDSHRSVRLTGDGYWFYPGHFMKDGLYYEPASLYLNGATLPATSGKSMNGARLAVKSGNLEFDTPPGASVLITDAKGDSIGYADSSCFSNFQGTPIIPRTGYFTPPLGFTVPTGSYAVRMNGFVDTVAHCSVYSDSTIYTYSRGGAKQNQRDELLFSDGVTLQNSDTLSKNVYLGGIILHKSVEYAFGAAGLILAHSDSLRITIENRHDILVQSGGSSKIYTLQLRSASSNGEIQFEHRGIPLPANGAHRIQPVWESLAQQPVKIRISHKNDGIFDDSLTVDNQVPSTGVESSGGVSLTYALSQNYPNPFNPSTVIDYSLPDRQNVSIVIYNVLGQRIASLVNEVEGPGRYTVTWKPDGSVATGVYFCRMHAGTYVATRKMLLMR